MAITKLLLLAFVENVAAYIIHVNFPKINATGTNITSHLQFKHIQRLCNNRHVCTADTTALCTVRLIDGLYEYRNFENSCFLFLNNMCDYPGKEFSIARGGACAANVTSRRMFVPSGVEPPPPAGPSTETTNSTESTRNSTRGNLRGGTSKKPKFSRLYSIIEAFDYHKCPLRCPDTYAPVCVGANRGNGKYFKFWTFENHCAGDLYYCKYWKRDFMPAPGESSEDVNSSPLAWSYCGAHRYLQFARFSESSSSMAHYGWLQGDFPYQHIMEPHQRKPGFG